MKRTPRLTRTMAWTGALAGVTAAAVGAWALRGSAATVPLTDGFPASTSEILALLDRPADLGALTAPARLASCLAGLGYPGGTAVLGARPVTAGGRGAVLLVLAADTPGEVAAVVVPGTCSAADTGLLADTVVPRP